MTERELRILYASKAAEYIGMQMGDERHRDIVDTYNTLSPLPRGYRLKYTDAFCQPFCTAIAIKTGLTEIFPMECGCGEAQKIAVSMGIWVEDDGYVPSVGDLVQFDWNDAGEGDAKGWPGHVAIVDGVDGDDEVIHLVNPNDGHHAVSRWSIPVNGKNIRGFICPDYASLEKQEGVIGICKTELYTRTGPYIWAPKCYIQMQDRYGIRCWLNRGEKVLIIGEHNGWYQIRCVGRYNVWTPWVSGKYIEIREGT